MFKKLIIILRSAVFKLKTKNYRKDVNILGKIFLWNTNIIVGNNVTIHPGVTFWGKGKITIGDNTAIGKDAFIFAYEDMEIGNDVLIAAYTYIVDCDHGVERELKINKQNLVSQKIAIKDDVWIGAGSKILKGSILNKGAVIGAMSLVNKEIESYSINVGVPSKKIKYRK